MEKNESYTCLDMLMSGKLLRNLIRKSGYTIRELQGKLHLACPQPIYRWQNGQTMPTIDNLYMLSSILGVHMEDMLMSRNEALWRISPCENRDRDRRMVIYRKKFAG